MIKSKSFPYFSPYSLRSSVLQIIIPQIFEYKSLLKVCLIDKIVGKHTMNVEVIVTCKIGLDLVFNGDDVVLMDISSLLDLSFNTQGTFFAKSLQYFLVMN